MKLSIVTCFYDIRASRHKNYYYLPALDLIKDLENQENTSLYFFTDQKDILEKKYSKNIKVSFLNYEDLIKDFWENPNWRQTYKKALSNRPIEKFEEKKFPELISLWLGKFKMMELASENSDFILWQDIGIRMLLFNKNINLYKKCKTNCFVYENKIEEILKNNPTALLKCEKKINPFHGIDMTKYANRDDLIRAGFILTRKEEILNLKNTIKNKWNMLIEQNDYGTEENPLTLYHWENNCTVLTYQEWIEKLNLSNKKIKHA